MTRALALVISLICVSVASLTATIKPAETRQPQYRVIESTEAGRMYVSKGILVFDIAEDEKTGFLGFDVLDLFWIKPEDFAFQARSFRHIGIGFTSGQEPQPSSVETLSLSVARNFWEAKIWSVVREGRGYVYVEDRRWCTSRIFHPNDHRDWSNRGNRGVERNVVYFNIRTFSDSKRPLSEAVLENGGCRINGRKDKEQEIEALANRPVGPEPPVFPDFPLCGLLRLCCGWGFFCLRIFCAAHSAHHQTAFGFVSFAICTFSSMFAWFYFVLA